MPTCRARAPFFLLVLRCCAIFMIGGPPAAGAQETTGGLRGRVVGPDGGPVPGAQVEIRGRARGLVRATATSERGEYVALGLPIGSYDVAITSVGFRPARLEGVNVTLGGVAALPMVMLSPAAVELEAIAVRAGAAALDAASPAVRTTLDVQAHENVPAGRDFTALAMLVPQVNPSFLGDGLAAGGATGLETGVYVDGVNTTEPRLGGPGLSLPFEFIEAVEVTTGGLEPEFGRSAGALINVVTYTGDDTWRGGAFGYGTGGPLTSATATSSAITVLPQRGDAAVEAGARMAGPLRPGHLWLSLAYSARDNRVEKLVPGSTYYPDHSFQHLFAAKLTWHSGGRTTGVLSLFGDPSHRHAVGPSALGTVPQSVTNPDPLLSYQRSGSTAASAIVTHQAGRLVQLEARASWLTETGTQHGETARGRSEALYEDTRAGASAWSGGYGGASETLARRTSGSLSASLTPPAHLTKIGVAWDRATGATAFRGELIQRTTDTTWVRIVTGAFGRSHGVVWSWFAQDAWQATSRLTVTGGVRWDRQRFFGPGDTVSFALNPLWQPRLGMVLVTGRDAGGRLTASAGRVLQDLPTYVTELAYADSGIERHYGYVVDPRTSGAQPADTIFDGSFVGPQPRVPGVRPQYYDELTLGYQRLAGRAWTLSAGVRYRTLRSAVTASFQAGTPYWVGNPGRAPLSYLPRYTRRYAALELDARYQVGPSALGASYVLSRTWGNYPGLFSYDAHNETPGQDWGLTLPEQIPNSSGDLPNDRRHVVRAYLSQVVGDRWTVGALGLVASGTPLSVLGAHPVFATFFPVYLRPRGTAGRMPWLWDLNLRLGWRLPGRRDARATLDWLHVGNPQVVTDREQFQYLATDAGGNQIDPNPNYGQPLAFSAPMTLRVGISAQW
jgi:carboxypeptidase family protein